MTNKRARQIVNDWMATEGEAGVPSPDLDHTEFANQALAYIRHHYGIRGRSRDFADRQEACAWLRKHAQFLELQVESA